MGRGEKKAHLGLLSSKVTYWHLTDGYFGFLYRLFHLYKQGDSGNKSQELRTGRKTCGRWKYQILMRDSQSTQIGAEIRADSESSQRVLGWGDSHRLGTSRQRRSKSLNIESQRGLRRYGVNDSSPSPSFLCLSLPFAVFRPFRVIKKRVYIVINKYCGLSHAMDIQQ